MADLRRSFWVVFLVVGVCAGPIEAATIRTVATGFDSPLYVTAPVGDGRLFVVERGGRIRIVDRDSGEIRARDFLTINDLLSGGEQGLLGVAFHPEYAENGRFFVCVTNPDGNTEVREYRVSADANVADVGSARLLLTINQPFANHNGGWLGFSPEGYLVIASGDGGSGNDPGNEAQDTNSRLGKILRIDVDRSEGGRNYAIPADNPFRSGGGAPEVWHFGVRNPWRCSFDRSTGDFYFGDVGQSAREEINRHRDGENGGKNFGWRVFEGEIRTPGIDDAVPRNAVSPIFAYPHSEGQSVTGGYVYRGPRAGNLRGWYVFGDFISGTVWAVRPTESGVGSRRTLSQTVPLLASFGEDGDGNLYAVSLGGEILRIDGDAAGASRPTVEITKSQVRPSGKRGVISGRIRGGAKPDEIRYRVGSAKRVLTRKVKRRFTLGVPMNRDRVVVRLSVTDESGRESKLVRVRLER